MVCMCTLHVHVHECMRVHVHTCMFVRTLTMVAEITTTSMVVNPIPNPIPSPIPNPPLTLRQATELRRLITMVDALYDAQATMQP